MNEGYSEIIMEHEGDKDATFDDFKSHFPADEPRMAIIDFKWTREDGRKGTSITFVLYVPDSCTSVEQKFAYANSKD